MASLLLLSLHAIANCIMTIVAGFLLWHSWKTDRESRRRFREIMEGTVKSRMESAARRVFGERGSVGEDDLSNVETELTDRHAYHRYLNGLKETQEFPLSFPEWRASRKEASNV